MLLMLASANPEEHVLPHRFFKLVSGNLNFGIERIPILNIDFGPRNFYFTNHLLMVLVAAALCLLLFPTLARRYARSQLEPSAPRGWSNFFEAMMQFIRQDVARPVLGHRTDAYIPFLWSLFFFILFCNLLGMIPYTFTVTSHIIVTFALAMVVFIGVTIVGFAKHGSHFLRLFVPSGVPVALLPLIVVIEVISYLTRPISLSVRLFANMMAGHTMLKVFGGFVVALGVIGGWAPLAFIVALTGLEIGIAFLQAYVFVILTCIYLNDAMHPGH